jgi:hypothetical protein
LVEQNAAQIKPTVATVANYLTAIKKSITNSLAATVFDARGTKASTI